MKIHARPATGLVDETLSIRVWGAEPGAQVEVRAGATDRQGGSWSSRAVFVADERGEVVLDRDAPVDGSYAGVDGMGLLWSMTPEARDSGTFTTPGSRPCRCRKSPGGLDPTWLFGVRWAGA